MSDIAPGFLVAVPHLADPNFDHAVVLMLEHGDNGAMGLVVNRPGSLMLSDVASRHGVVRSEFEKAPVFTGGPVEPERGFVLHDRTDLPEAVQLFGGLAVSGSIESLKVLFRASPDRFRLCLGYAGWGPGQLEKELREGSWLSAPPDARHVLDTPPEQAWEAVIRGMGIDPKMLLASGGGGHLQ